MNVEFIEVDGEKYLLHRNVNGTFNIQDVRKNTYPLLKDKVEYVEYDNDCYFAPIGHTLHWFLYKDNTFKQFLIEYR